jgi:hypothetical protein
LPPRHRPPRVRPRLGGPERGMAAVRASPGDWYQFGVKRRVIPRRQSRDVGLRDRVGMRSSPSAVAGSSSQRLPAATGIKSSRPRRGRDPERAGRRETMPITSLRAPRAGCGRDARAPRSRPANPGPGDALVPERGARRATGGHAYHQPSRTARRMRARRPRSQGAPCQSRTWRCARPRARRPWAPGGHAHHQPPRNGSQDAGETPALPGRGRRWGADGRCRAGARRSQEAPSGSGIWIDECSVFATKLRRRPVRLGGKENPERRGTCRLRSGSLVRRSAIAEERWQSR